MLRDGLLRRSEASALRWGDVDVQEDGSARLHVRKSKTDPEAEGAVLYIGPYAAAALVAIIPEGFAVVDPSTPVFGLSASQIGRRVNAAGQGGRRATAATRSLICSKSAAPLKSKNHDASCMLTPMPLPRHRQSNNEVST